MLITAAQETAIHKPVKKKKKSDDVGGDLFIFPLTGRCIETSCPTGSVMSVQREGGRWEGIFTS